MEIIIAIGNYSLNLIILNFNPIKFTFIESTFAWLGKEKEMQGRKVRTVHVFALFSVATFKGKNGEIIWKAPFMKRMT